MFDLSSTCNRLCANMDAPINSTLLIIYLIFIRILNDLIYQFHIVRKHYVFYDFSMIYHFVLDKILDQQVTLHIRSSIYHLDH